MKIRFKGFSRRALGKYHPGSIEDLPEEIALTFIKTGYAEAVKDSPFESAAMPVRSNETASVESEAKPRILSVPAVFVKKNKKKKRK